MHQRSKNREEVAWVGMTFQQPVRRTARPCRALRLDCHVLEPPFPCLVRTCHDRRDTV